MLVSEDIKKKKLIALPSIDMRVCAESNCNLLCGIRLISLGGLFFSEGKRRKNGSGGEGKAGGGSGKSRGKLQLGCNALEKNEKQEKETRGESHF